MNIQNINIGQLISQILALMRQIVGMGFIVILFAAVMKIFGFAIPHVFLPNATELAYLAGAYWLVSKAG